MNRGAEDWTESLGWLLQLVAGALLLRAGQA
jgi:hypothetical protein